MRPSQLLAALTALSSLSAAWPDVFDSHHAVERVENLIYGRADSSDSNSATSGGDSRQTTEAPKSTGDATASDKPTATKDSDSKTTDKASDKASDTASGSKKGSKTTGKAKATNFADDVPAGGINMVTPAAIGGQQFYKVGDWVTFAWNYTSLSMTPSHVDIMATCTVNSATYTIAVNQSVKETGRVLWDTKNYMKDHPNAAPFLTETYTLLIYDAASSVSATAKPGYLAAYSGLQFGMYIPREPTKWADWTCANCKSAGLSSFEMLTLKAMLFTSATSIVSMLYFAYSFGVW